MATINQPELKFTPVEEIKDRVNTVRTTFFQHKTRPVEFRLLQLRKLYWAVKDREHLIKQAVLRDLGKSEYEAFLSEIALVENDVVFVTKNLAKWAKDEKAEDIDFPFSLMKPTIRKDPLGCVLVIGAFNVPFMLTLGPLIGAIAAGNTAIVKPSETSPNCAIVLQEIIEAAFDPSCVQVVQGGVTEMKVLLDERWDKICFTGSDRVGRIIAQAAAPKLTPVLLELGGRNPAFITKRADLRLAARRLLWGKTLNSGQICTSQNYILADREVIPQLVEEFKTAMKEYYPNGAKASPDYGRIVNDASFRRLKGLIDESNGKIVLGGTMDEKERFIEPTIVQVESVDDPLLAQETFGPIFSVLAVSDLDEAIRIANSVDSTPLALYSFGDKKEVEKVLSSVRSGGASINDAFMHVSVPTLPFGGVGESGTGCYHGRSSFDAFTHRRSITTTPGWVERVLSVRYPPYAGKLKSSERTNLAKPNFDRNGRRVYGLLEWLVWFATFGGGANKRGVIRSATVVMAAIAIQFYTKRGAKL